jgi:glycosyltransferase involved in cell wall biosynthesis
MGGRLNQLASKFDVFHAPHFPVPLGLKIPSVVTIHDLIQVHFPERFWYPAMAKFLVRSSMRRARRVCAVSAATASDLIRLEPARSKHRAALSEKLRVVGNALEPRWLGSMADTLKPELPAGISAGFLLAVISTDKPHKGLEDLLAVYRELSARSISLPQLVLAGTGIVPDRLRESHPDLLRTKRVQPLGRVSEPVLRSLYLNCRAVVIASRIEGFGLPVLEAHAYGKPAVLRPDLSLLEIARPHDVVAKDWSRGALSEAILHCLERHDAVSVAKEREHLQAQFSSDRMADKLVAVYREACGRGQELRGNWQQAPESSVAMAGGAR